MEKMTVFFPFISVYGGSCKTPHVKKLRKILDNNYFIGAFLMDISKANVCILP